MDNSACQGYWVQIKTYDPTVPPIYKCMQQAEYDAYRADLSAENKEGGMLVAVVFGSIVVLVILTGIVYGIVKLVRHYRHG